MWKENITLYNADFNTDCSIGFTMLLLYILLLIIFNTRVKKLDKGLCLIMVQASIILIIIIIIPCTL